MTEPREPEGQPPTYEQTRQMYRSLTEKVLDRAASDPEWRQLLIDDPELAMREAEFEEAQQLEQGSPTRPQEREVVGQRYGYGYGYGRYGGGYGYGRRRCQWHWSRRWGWYRSY